MPLGGGGGADYTPVVKIFSGALTRSPPRVRLFLDMGDQSDHHSELD